MRGALVHFMRFDSKFEPACRHESIVWYALSMRFSAIRRTSLGVSVTCGLLLACMVLATTTHAHGPLDRQIESITAEIEGHPFDADLYWRRGELHRLDREWKAASSDYDRALGLDPEFDAVHLGYALLWMDTNRPAEALSAIDRYLSRRPHHAEALFLRGRALAELGRTTEAVRSMDRAIEESRSPTPEQYIERARVCAFGGIDHLQAALEGLDQGIDRLGPVVSLELYAVDLEQALGRYDAALLRLEDLADQYSRRESLLARRGEILEAAGRDLESQAAYTEALLALEELPAGARNTKETRELERALRRKLEIPVGEAEGAP